MKRTATLVIAFLLSLGCSAQRLTLNDLLTFCSMKNWEDVNQSLINKNWVYYDSEKGSTDRYSTITWAFEKDFYSKKARGWIYLYSYEGLPHKIHYNVFNLESYSLVQNAITKSGFKLVKSEINDNAILSIYKNSIYTLEVDTEKRVDPEYEDRNSTSYTFTIIKNSGVYDPDNGKKTSYYSSGVIKTEYTLLNGELSGEFKSYHENGKLKKKGHYVNGKGNGKFVVYTEEGELESEYQMVNGLYEGTATFFEEGKLSVTATFKADEKNGPAVEYYYDDEGELILKDVGNYLNDKKSGTWRTILVARGMNKEVEYVNYEMGIKNGPFQSAKNDSLIVGNYVADKLNGPYRVYIDLSRRILKRGPVNTDTTKINIVGRGHYQKGLKHGSWTTYDLLKGGVISQGEYRNDLKTGIWSYYLEGWRDAPYSGQLFLECVYQNGMKNGKSVQYINYKEEKYLCNETEKLQANSDTCTREIYERIREVSNYKNGLKHGSYELRDSTGAIVFSGDYISGRKEGEWTERLKNNEERGGNSFYVWKGNYLDGKETGKWEAFKEDNSLAFLTYFNNGTLDGEFIVFDSKGRKREQKIFKRDYLEELLIYDTVGTRPKFKYDIFQETANSYKVKYTRYFSAGGSTSEVYWINKKNDINHASFRAAFHALINSEGNDSDCYRSGEFKLTNDEGKPIVVGDFYKNDKAGVWSFYYYDQGVKLECVFMGEDDVKANEKFFTLSGAPFTGEFTSFDDTNSVKEIVKIEDGLRNGKTLFLDTKTNKVIKKEVYKNGTLKE